MRWVVLFLSCLLMFGNFFAYDLPAALNVPLQEYFGDEDSIYQNELATLYSIYSLPNIFLPLLGGWLIDRFGSGKLTVFLSFFQLFGQTIFSFGTTIKSWNTMYLGRAVFGFGGESLFVAQTRMTTDWFKGKELAFALGVNLAMARMGSVGNDFISPLIGLNYGIPEAMWFGFLTCLMSFLCAVALNVIDRNHDSVTGLKKDRYEFINMEGSGTNELGDQEEINFFEELEEFDNSFTQNTKKDDRINLNSIFNFPVAFWLLCFIMILMYATVIPFNTIHSAFLQTKWYKGDPQTASQIMAVPDTISAVLVPFVGTFVDKFGHRNKVLILCGVIMGVVHYILGTATIESLSTPVPCLGFAYCLLLTFWPCISLVVQEDTLATALGIATATSNASWTIFPIIVASLITRDPTYYLVEMFFVGCCVLGIICCLILYYVDKKYHDGILELPELKTLKKRRSSSVFINSSVLSSPITIHGPRFT
ncbi:hypothetical protein HDU92_004858 [Lobulomyces angularis]|nr:hypothetical protein HDU92_004858 [Lobulomyces angularis]